MSAIIVEPRPVEHQITFTDVECSTKRLNNSRASGRGKFPGELLKCRIEIFVKPIADIFNRALTEQQTYSSSWDFDPDPETWKITRCND